MSQKGETMAGGCPFFRDMGNKGNSYEVIRCANKIDAGDIKHIELTIKKRSAAGWRDDFCFCECYEGCVFYQAIKDLTEDAT